jgi:hypothetical protein
MKESGVGDIKIVESESEVLCTDSTALVKSLGGLRRCLEEWYFPFWI